VASLQARASTEQKPASTVLPTVSPTGLSDLEAYVSSRLSLLVTVGLHASDFCTHVQYRDTSPSRTHRDKRYSTYRDDVPLSISPRLCQCCQC
jgi:hypothetical protein